MQSKSILFAHPFRRWSRTSCAFIAALVFIAASLTLSACQSSKKAATPPGLPVSSTPGGASIVVPTLPPVSVFKNDPTQTARPLTSMGENFSARFASDGRRLIFLSRTRLTHKQAQVYELDLVRMVERRLTFHDGDDASPAWTSSGRFVYSSSTDELKEDAYAIGKLRAQYGKAETAPKLDLARASDLYLQREDGREIERLTKVAGFDGQPAPDPKAWRVVFVSDRDGHRSLYSLEKNGTRKLTTTINDDSPVFSNDGKDVAWVHHLDDGSSQIYVAPIKNMKQAVALTPPGHRDLDPSFNPSGDKVVFSSDRTGKVLNLFTTDRAGCIKPITNIETDVREPSWSPDGDRIAFTLPTSGLRQIYVMDLKSDAIPCLAVEPAKTATPAPTPPVAPSASGPLPSPAPVPSH